MNNEQINSLEIESLLAQVQYLEQQLSETNHELREVSTRLEQTESELEQAQTELTALRTVIARARDIREWNKPSLITVTKLANAALMSLERVKDGWVLRMGNLTSRVYKRLKQIWLLLTQDFYLHDIILRPDEGGETPVPDAKPRLPKRNPCLASLKDMKSLRDWEMTPQDVLDTDPEFVPFRMVNRVTLGIRRLFNCEYDQNNNCWVGRGQE